MTDLKFRAAPLLLVLALAAAGCRPAPSARPTGPEEARTTLTAGLDAWKNGEQPDALLGRDSITFVDPHWQKGLRLIGYELSGDGAMSGFDWQCKVKLSVQDASGQKSEQRAVYNVSASPKRVVVRFEM